MKKLALVILTSSLILSGCVETALVASAVTAVGAVNDPRSVGKQIDDSGIEVKATIKLMKIDEISDNTNVSVTSYNGHVLVVGQAPNKALIDMVTDELKKIDQVVTIHNQMKIAPLATVGVKTKDTWITAKVKSELLSSDEVDGNTIKVVTENQEVYLMGIVTPQQADVAAKLAAKVTDVKRVIKVFQ
jgi:osmotically-inducible protein OsmY